MTVFDCLDPVSRRDGMDAATAAARGGRLVVLPTDTVYGIGADAFSAHAVRDLLAAKGRGPDMPVPVLIGSTATLSGLVVSVPPRARLLMDAFWPGGLSLILEHAPSLSWNLGDTRNTVMVRMPLHPIALELLRAVGPMAVSSANISGRPPATTAEQAQSQLSDSVSVFLDAGPSPVGVASTVVDLTGETPVVRRIGAVSVEQLRAVLPEIEVPAELLPADAAPVVPESVDATATTGTAPDPAADGLPEDAPGSTSGPSHVAGEVADAEVVVPDPAPAAAPWLTAAPTPESPAAESPAVESSTAEPLTAGSPTAEPLTAESPAPEAPMAESPAVESATAEAESGTPERPVDTVTERPGTDRF